jgi:hypothetical protein
MTDDPASKQEPLRRLRELVFDHVGLPRPKQSAHIQTLQDELLPAFLDLARHAWLAASLRPLTIGMSAATPIPPTYRYLQQATETQAEAIHKLKDILQELGVDALLEAVATSPDAAMVSDLPVDEYEERLLREAGHRNPGTAVRDYLAYATTHAEVMADSNIQLQKAEKALRQANRDINVIINLNVPTSPPEGTTDSAAKPKRIKLFSGIGKLASGLVLLSGNAIVIPTVAIGSLTALPVLGSLAAGIAAVGDGVSRLLGEGEQKSRS